MLTRSLWSECNSALNSAYKEKGLIAMIRKIVFIRSLLFPEASTLSSSGIHLAVMASATCMKRRPVSITQIDTREFPKQ